MIGLKLPEGLEKRLTDLAHSTKRSKCFYICEAIQEYLEEHEDYLLASASYEVYVKSGQKGISLKELQNKYRLEDDAS